MSFRKLSLIFITTLLTILLLLQWWSINSFSQSVSQQVGESAFEVSRATAQKLIADNSQLESFSFAVTTQVKELDQQKIRQTLQQIKQDVVIQLIDKQKDDFILLSADGSNYEIPIPRTGIDESLDKFSNNVLVSTIALLVAGVLITIFFTNKMAAPLSQLQQASGEIGAGNFGVQIKTNSKWQSKEIEMTLSSFNHMSERIVALQKQNESFQNKAHLIELAEVAKGLAHTIRNPLNTLNLAVDELQSEGDNNKRKELASVAKFQVRRIDKWIRSLMDMMNSDNSLTQEIDIIKIIDSVIDDVQLRDQTSRQIQFQRADSSLKLIGIESELKGILQGLIANALEASPNDQPITIHCESDDDTHKIIIDDNGKGFSKTIIDNLFTPHNTDKTYGAGMGLYLAHRIVKYKYQGELVVENKSKGGSRVTMLIKNRG